jgi:hypothetical protein
VIGMANGSAEAEEKKNGEHFELKRNVASGLCDIRYMVPGTNCGSYKSYIADTSTALSTRASVQV